MIFKNRTRLIKQKSFIRRVFISGRAVRVVYKG